MDNEPVVIDVYANGTLTFGEASYRCSLGPSGITREKTEGDGATPIGEFPLRRVLYRPDRIDRPVTGLDVMALSENDGWCDDVNSSDYNKPISLPSEESHERLWREDHIYDVIVELGFNDNPPVPGKGSAIFLHVAREEYTPTQGCVALMLGDLLSVLKRCDPGAMIRINPDDA